MEFRPLVSLIIILLVCGIFSGGSFFEISVVEGHLYGRLIDILRNGSRYMILAIGMSMVLATGGTDISVGSVMAISGALACSIVDQRILAMLHGNVFAAVGIALLAGALCGAWNGFLVAKLKVQPIVAPEVIRVFKALIVIVICLAQSPAFVAKLKNVFGKKKVVA